jgi:hypothetical protein
MADCYNCGRKLPLRHREVICDPCWQECAALAERPENVVTIEPGVPIESQGQLDELVYLMCWHYDGEPN